jgi:hypothetical protein
MLQYIIETRIQKGKEIISRTSSNIFSEQSMRISEIKSRLKTDFLKRREEIESEKFEGENVFTNDNVTIQPQKWLLYTISLKD